MPETSSPREQILRAAIETIEAEGIENATVRNIAERAGVNIAAINYYFGSKGHLIEMVVAQVLETGFSGQFKDIREEQGDLPPREMVRQYFLYTLEGMHAYPGISRFLLQGPLMRAEYDPRVLGAMHAGLEELLAYAKEALTGGGTAEGDDEALRTAIAGVLSAVVIAGIAPGMFESFLGYELTTTKGRERFVDHLMADIDL